MKRRRLTADELSDSERLQKIWNAHKASDGLSQEKMAHLCGWKTQAAFSQYLLGRIPLNLDALIRISKVLRIDPMQVSPKLASQLRTVSAVSIQEPPPTYGTRIPLVMHDQVIDWPTERKTTDPVEWVACPVKCGPETFAVQARGVSMLPRYDHGDLVFVDPGVTPEHGRDAVVVFDREWAIREIVAENTAYFARAINPEWPGPKLVPVRESTIRGVVIGKWVAR